MTGVNYQFKQTTDALEKLKLTGLLVKDVPRFLEVLGNAYLRRVSLQFSKGLDPYQTPWAKGAKGQGRTLVLTSLLSRSFTKTVSGRVLKLAVGGPAAAYAQHHHFGTGIYGPKNKRITPTSAKALAFKVNGRVIFRRSVAGVPRRLLLPIAGRGLPAAWKDDAVKVLRGILK